MQAFLPAPKASYGQPCARSELADEPGTVATPAGPGVPDDGRERGSDAP